MSKGISELYIVEAKMLPEVFVQVCRAKELLETGECTTVAQAVAKVGISRSAFYKYRDSITPFREMKNGQVLTLSVIMRDKAGVLSSVLTIFAGIHANILTINQSLPTNGVAITTISFAADMSITLDELRIRLAAIPDVMRVELLGG